MKAPGSEGHISLVTKLGFGSGDIFGGGAMTLIGVYYLFFLTDVLRINPSLAGIVILISKTWDAVSDPLMGTITDRTGSRFGRRRLYFLIGAPLIFCALVLLWFPANFPSEIARFFYALLSYLFFSTVYTLVLIPYYALASELTLDYHERSSLMSVRMVFSAISAMACGVLPMTITVRTEGGGYAVMGVVFGLLFSLPFLAVFFTTSERESFRQVKRAFTIPRAFAEPMHNRSFRNVLVMYLFTFVAMDIVLSVVIYFMTYYLRMEKDSNLILGALMAVQVCAIPVYFAIGKRWGKTAAYSVSGIIWIAAMLSSLLLKPGAEGWVMLLFGAGVGLGTSGTVLMVWSIFADIPDVDELASGERREGLYSGLFTFMRKASSAASLFLVSNLLHVAGYRNPGMAESAVAPVFVEQTGEFVIALRLMFAVIPAVFVSVALVGAARFPLTPDLHDKLRNLLEKRRLGINEVDSRAESRLKSVLLGERTRNKPKFTKSK